MLLTVTNGEGELQTVVVCGQEQPTDASSSILVTDESQILLNANAGRSGWFIQNVGSNPMYVNELGGAASPEVNDSAGSFKLVPGAFFPTPGMALTTAQINICGTAGDNYVAREW